MTARRRTALLLAGGLALAATAWGQAQGRVTGKILDPQGEPIEGATVTLEAQEILLEVTDTTNRKGRYTIAVVDATKGYTITISAEGFQTHSQPIDVPLGDALRADFTLAPAGATGAPTPRAEETPEVSKAAAEAYNAGAEAYNAGDIGTAIAKFEEALTEQPDLLPALEILGGLYVEGGRFDEAMAVGEKILAADPDNLAGLTVRFDALTGLGRHDEADALLERLFELDPGRETAVRLFNDGVTALQANDLDAAAARFEQVIQATPEIKEAYQAVGRVYIQQKRYDVALERADQLLEMDPGNVTGLSVRYDALRGLDRDEEADAAFKILTEADPEAVGEAFFKQGREMFENGATESAIVALEKAVEARPDHARTHYYLGLSYASAGNNEGAKTHLSRFVELAPDDPEAPTAQEMLKYYD